MAEILVNIGGVQEAWQGWVMPNGESEYNSLPDSLKPLTRSLARRSPELTPYDELLDYYKRIEGLSLDPQSGVTDADAVPYLARIQTQAERLAREQKKRAAPRELPLHIGAVFANGRNERLVEDPSIPVLDIKDRNQRLVFCLENIHAFDHLFGQAEAWKGAVDLWIADAQIAAQAEGLSEVEWGRFEKQIKNLMAITASARAMEASAGASTTYLATLTGGEEGNLDRQGLWADYLVHGDPGKINYVISNPLVKHYYEILMRDAGLHTGDHYEWREIQNPDKPSETIWLPSKVEFEQNPDQTRRQSNLIRYLKDYAENGGLNAYITSILLAADTSREIQALKNLGIEKDSRWAAARIACDVFLTDKWTRYEDKITDGGQIELNLQPSATWEGDPFKTVDKPSFLPRLKGVFTGKEGKVILDLMDRIFKPDEILTGNLERYLVVPSAAINMKKYARLSKAIFKFMGGSMGTGIPSWNRKMMEEEIPEITNLYTQVYGGIKVKRGGRTIKEGKHLVGDRMMLMLYTKALAASLEVTKPDFKDKMANVFDSERETRPFMDVMTYLWGPNRDGKRGFIDNTIGERLNLVVDGNIYNAKLYYEELWSLLKTGDAKAGNLQALMQEYLSGIFATADIVNKTWIAKR
jgi:hypothetical protein